MGRSINSQELTLLWFLCLLTNVTAESLSLFYNAGSVVSLASLFLFKYVLKAFVLKCEVMLKRSAKKSSLKICNHHHV